MYLDGYMLDEIIDRGRWSPRSTVVLGYIRSVSAARRAQVRPHSPATTVQSA